MALNIWNFSHRDIEEKVSKEIDEMTILTSEEYRIYLEKIVQYISMNYSLRVKLDLKASTASTDGAVVNINPFLPFLKDMTLAQKTLINLGFLAHELFHILFTDFKVLKRLESEPKEKVKLLKTILNIVEDSAIELIGTNYFVGDFKKAIIFLNKIAFEKLTKPVEKEKTKLSQIMNAMMSYSIIGKIKGDINKSDVKDLFLKLKPLIDKARYVKTTNMRYDISLEIYDILKENIDLESSFELSLKTDHSFERPSSKSNSKKPDVQITSDFTDSFKEKEKDEDEKKGEGDSDKESDKTDGKKSSDESKDTPECDSDDIEEDKGSSDSSKSDESKDASGSDSEDNEDDKDASGDSKADKSKTDDKKSSDESKDTHGSDSDDSEEDKGTSDSSKSSKSKDTSGSDSEDNEDENSSDSSKSGKAESEGKPNENDSKSSKADGSSSDKEEGNSLDGAEDKTDDDLEDIDSDIDDKLSSIDRDLEDLKEEVTDKAINDKETDMKNNKISDVMKDVSYTSLHSSTKKIIKFLKPNGSEHDINSYNKIYEEYMFIINNTTKQLKKILTLRESALLKGQQLGSFHSSSVTRMFTDCKIFARNKDKEEIDLSFQILVDKSGSMSSYKRMDYAKKACIVISEICRKLNIPCSIISFDDNFRSNDIRLTHILDFNDKEHYKYNIMTLEAGCDNRDGLAVRYAGEYLIKNSPSGITKKVLICLSDGAPEHGITGYSGDTGIADTKENVEYLEKKGIKVIGINIGGCSNVGKIYEKRYIDITNLEELPVQFIRILKREF